jgi:hypothetical protein
MKSEILIWDWKDQIPVDELNRAVRKGYRYFQNADSEGDWFALVCTKTKVSLSKAQELYEKFMEAL